MKDLDIRIKRTATEDLIPSYHDDYIDTGIVGLLDKLAWGRPLVLKGPKGSGKTLSIEQWAAKQGVPMVRQDCSEDIGLRDLIGTFGIQGEEVYYGLGSVTTAIDIANNEGGCVLVLEEVNTLPAKAQKILNSVCDYRQAIEVAKIGKVFKVKKGHKIWVVGTMNPNYSGTYSLNEDFRSRWGFLNVGYMTYELEKDLLEKSFSRPIGAAERNIVERILELAEITRTGKLGDYALSTRDLVHFVHDFEALGIQGSLKMLEGKFEDIKDIKDYRAQIASKFEVELKNFSLINHND